MGVRGEARETKLGGGQGVGQRALLLRSFDFLL